MNSINLTDDLPDEEAGKPTLKERRRSWGLLIGCVGVVYGDIGTSPLYAFRESVRQISAGGIRDSEIYGILSLIIWSLLIIVTVKYVIWLLRADNKGEGGILSLMALVRKKISRRKDLVLFTGAMGAALFYGDASITPAISVLSAVEGLELVTPAFKPYILSLSVLILCLLFFFQKGGTGKIATLFGPITVLWFLAIAVTGVLSILTHPEVLWSVSPHYGIQFLMEHGWASFVVLGAVVLAITGAEALYADMGHFGRKPIQQAWLYFVLPCLVLNYLGQGALVLQNPETAENPFYLMVPEGFLLPMVILATCATIIASQAVITGAFSLTRQAIQLGLLPRMEIRHTSGEHAGQIYIPKVNKTLLIMVLFLCILFQRSEGLAAAYGIAVCGTMVITTILALFFVAKFWKKSYVVALLIISPFLVIEMVFLIACMLRVFDGGVIPLLLGGYILLLMITWVYGTRYLAKRAERQAVRITDFSENLDQNPPHVVKGTAIFFTSDPLNAPEALLKNLQYNQIIHEQNIILTVMTSTFPTVPENQRLHVEMISSRLTRVVVHFGFMETPDVVRALSLAGSHGLNIDVRHATYFMARRKIVSDPNRGLPGWQDKIYIALTRFAIGEHDFFNLPRTRVVELGVQVMV
ncbi:MAG: potassium transporter Kup [Alphaproteobacteria bacterium]|nr:potassium transporter Kup [Alphaproteobacteria bacterium]